MRWNRREPACSASATPAPSNGIPIRKENLDDTTPGTEPRARSRIPFYDLRWRTYFVRLALELIIVFAGVYFASAFVDHQKAKETEQRRHQIRQALMREIEMITNNTRRASAGVKEALVYYQREIEQKKYPPLEPFLEPVRVEAHMWDATLASGGLDLFDVPTVYALSSFYNELNEGFATLNQLRDLSERMLLPVAGAPASEYYDLASGKVRPRYAWYFEQQKRLARIAGQITEMGDSLLVELRRQEGGAAKPDTIQTETGQ